MKNPMMPSRYKVIKIIRETTAEHTFRVACDIKAEHGQFFQLSIPKIGEAPISVSGKGDGWLEFTIRKVGRLTEGVFGLNEGDTLFARGPYGNSYPMDSFKGQHLLVICGGTGLAAVHSMLEYYHDNITELKSLHLIAGFKDLNCVLFDDHLVRFRTSMNAIYTLDNGVAEGFEKGLVTAHINKIPLSKMYGCNAVIVGPPAMMHFAALECVKQGIEEANMWLSFERKMYCAIGKCGHCKINETYVCLEGPVFNYTKAKTLLD